MRARRHLFAYIAWNANRSPQHTKDQASSEYRTIQSIQNYGIGKRGGVYNFSVPQNASG
jgi:hypothetical protein